MELSLSKQLKMLKIDLFGIELSSICAWNDKHSSDKITYLNWFTKSLTESNVLEPSDREEHEFLRAKDLLLDEEYDIAIADIERTCPGIFDEELNKSQIFILESEYDTLKEFERKIEIEIEINLDISKHLLKEIRSSNNKKDILNISYENVYEMCFGESMKVDTAFSDLRLKVLNCLEVWKNDRSIFSGGDEMKIKTFKDDLAKVIKFCDDLTLDSITFELEHSINVELEALQKRLYEGILYSYVAELKKKLLENELTFYKDCDFSDYALRNLKDPGCLILVESLASSRTSLELFKEFATDYVQEHVNELNNIKLEVAAQKTRKKYESLYKIESIIQDILDHNATHLNLFKIIDERIETVDLLLREELLSIVNGDLRSCIRRTELTKERIQQEKDDQQQPIEKQNQLIRIIVDLISDEHIEEINPDVFKSLINKFYGTILDNEMKLSFIDIEQYRRAVNIEEKNIYFIKEHLKSRSSNEILLCPLEYTSALCALREASKEADHIIAKAIQLKKSTDETLNGNKWLRIKRQLWMNFLVNPTKLQEHLKSIAEEINKKISNQQDNKIIHNAHKYNYE